jgi:hypothetical protein
MVSEGYHKTIRIRKFIRPYTYLRSLTIPNSFEINPKNCVQIVGIYISCSRNCSRNASSVETNIQSSESRNCLLNCGIDLVFFAAISSDFEDFDGRVEFDDFGCYIREVSFEEINESYFLDSISYKAQGYCSADSRASTFQG